MLHRAGILGAGILPRHTVERYIRVLLSACLVPQATERFKRTYMASSTRILGRESGLLTAWPRSDLPGAIRSITLAPKKLIRTRCASEGSASEHSLARRVSICKDAKLSCRVIVRVSCLECVFRVHASVVPQSDHDLRGDSATGYQQSCPKLAESESIILTAHTRSPARCDRVRQWSSWSAMVWSC